MATINGSDLMLFVEKNGSKKSVAYATNHTLEVSVDTKETSTKDNGNGLWQNSELGMMSWTTSTENLMSDTSATGLSYNDLFDLMLNRTKIDVVFALQSNIPNFNIKDETSYNVPNGGWSPDTSNHFKGSAYITSLSVTAQNGEKATMSATFTGAGPLIKVGNGIVKSATPSTTSLYGED